MNKRSVDKEARLLKVWEETGHDKDKTAAVLGYTSKTVLRYLNRAGVTCKSGPEPIIDDETIKRVWEECGRRPGLAAVKLGYHRMTVTLRLKAMGLTSKRGRYPKEKAA
jgi:DNA-binding NtrC family response regulator